MSSPEPGFRDRSTVGSDGRCRRRRGRREDLWRGPGRAPGARRRVAARAGRRGRRDPRPLRDRQVDAAAPDRRARPARGGRRSRSPASGSRARASARCRGCGGRRIGFVFQFFHLLPELSGEANVLLAGRVRGASPGAAARGQRADRPARAAPGRGVAAAPAQRRRAAALRDRAGAGQRPGACCWPTSRPATSTSQAGAEVLRLLRAGADEGRAVVMVTHEAAAAEHRRPRPDAARRPPGRRVTAAARRARAAA